MAGAFDFKTQVVRLFNDPELGEGQLHIWGGKLEKNDTETLEQVLEGFLAAWGLPSRQMPWRIWEYANRIQFKEEDAVLDAAQCSLLERGRVFGTGGDLSLRRDGDRWLWHFISTIAGPPTQGPDWDARNFWKERPDREINPNLRLRQRTEKALLWGEYRKTEDDQNYWHEDRVARATLAYPHAPAKRLEIEYDVFTDGGQVAFTWWKGVRKHG